MNGLLGRTIAAVLLASLWTFHAPACAANIVEEIVARTPDRSHSYAQMCSKLSAFQQSDRVSLLNIGTTAKGRGVYCVALHDPKTVFGQTPRLFVVARQHGNETSGTEAVMALIHHLTVSPGALEQEILRRVTIIAVPMANPDGADADRRANSRGVDLNRNWQSLSQPETLAIDRAARAWRPNAVMDLHELPASASKPAYRENFVETIGEGAGIPQLVSQHSSAASIALAGWLRSYGHRANIYYDGPGKDRSLCHRHFGLDYGIPSFLLEAKTGSGRSLKHRVSFHVLGMLVVANHLMNSQPGAGTSPGPQLCQTPAGPAAQPGPTGPATVALQYGGASPQDTAQGSVSAVVGGGHDVRYVKFYLDGRLWHVTNDEPYECPVSAETCGDGQHQVRVDVVGSEGQVLTRAERMIQVQDIALGK